MVWAPAIIWNVAFGQNTHCERRPHAKIDGDLQSLVQHGGGLLLVSEFVSLQEHVGVVVESLGEFRPVGRLAAEGQRVFKMALSIVEVAYRIWEQAKKTVNSDDATELNSSTGGQEI